MFQDPNKVNTQGNSLAFSNFLNEVDAGRVVEVQIQGNNISGILADGKKFKTYSPNYFLINFILNTINLKSIDYFI